MSEDRISKTIRFTKEENKRIIKEMFRLSEENRKMLSYNDTIRFIVNEYLNGNIPPYEKPSQNTDHNETQDTAHNEVQNSPNNTKGMFADILV
jgi:hypothetical protein